MAWRVYLPSVCRQDGLAGNAGTLGLWRLSVSSHGHSGNDLSGQPLAAHHLVSGDVARDQPKNGVSALGLQRVLGLGSYKTAWAMLHKLRRALVRPGRDRLRGVVEVDETYWGGEEEGVAGRLTEEKALMMVAAEEDGKGIGRIRLRRVLDLTRTTLHGFIAQSIDLDSTVRTAGLNAYLGMEGYVHDRQVQRRQPEGEHLLPRVHRVVSLLKRCLLGTHQGAIGHEYLDYYLDEFTFRFNRRKSPHRGKLFYRLAQQAVQVEPAPFDSLLKPQSLGGGGVK